MDVITERDRIKMVVKKWSLKYESGAYGQDKIEILKKLKNINLNTVSAKEVESIIGNSTWTDLICDECGEHVTKIVQVGEELNDESATARLCTACLRKAYYLAVNTATAE